MIRNAKIIILLIFTLAVSGCEGIVIGRHELADIIFPGVAAVDKSKDSGDGVVLTISPKKSISSQGGGGQGDGGQKQSDSQGVMQQEGASVFAANRIVTSFSQKDVHWGQNEYIIIGEEAAKEGVLEYIEFFVRDHETRLNTAVIVAKGSDGKKIIEAAEAASMPLVPNIDNLFKNDGALSYISRVVLSEFLHDLSSDYSAAVIPAIRLVELNTESPGEEETSENVSLQINSCAFFKNFKLIGYLEGDDARVINLLSNNIRSGAIIVNDPQGNTVSLEIVNSKAKIKPKIENDVPSIDIQLRFSSNIAEMQGKKENLNEQTLIFLQNQQSEKIKGEIARVIDYTKQKNADVFKFGEAIFRRYPVKWQSIKEKWQEIYPTLQVNVNVESVINRSYIIDESLGTMQKGY